ncbi:MAG: heme-dependent oxidative N-demethylase family protein [Roseinatronobacter sp.]
MPPILNTTLPYAPWVLPQYRRLPGVMPLPRADWLFVDDAYAAQMAERAQLLATRPDDVLALLPEAENAARELLDEVLKDLSLHGFSTTSDRITRPDGVSVQPDPARPLWTLGHLLQADFCILQKQGDEHVLTGAVLCFPSSWTLREKLGKPLMRIHVPVASYDAGMGARVQRMFDLMRPEQPLWRANLLRYTNPALFQPRAEFAPKDKSGDGDYIRSERQCLLKLPRTEAVIFSIHTAQVRRSDLTDAQHAALREIDRSA